MEKYNSETSLYKFLIKNNLNINVVSQHVDINELKHYYFYHQDARENLIVFQNHYSDRFLSIFVDTNFANLLLHSETVQILQCAGLVQITFI